MARDLAVALPLMPTPSQSWNLTEGAQKASGRLGSLITAGCGALQKEMLVNLFYFLLCSKELFQKMLSRSVFLAANTQLLFHLKVFIKSNIFKTLK